MKRLLIVFSLGIGFMACEDVIDKKLLNAIDSDNVWNDESLSTLYLNSLYLATMPTFSALNNITISDESFGSGTGTMMYGQLSMTDSYGNYGVETYGRIRDINILLTNLDNGNLSDEIKDLINGQAYFLRAWEYWTLVLYYGGVPITTDPLDVNDGDAIYLARNSAKECVDQIVSDLDNAIALLPSSYNDSDYGRVTKSAAAALKGRVLLYYASPQFNPENDQTRWQAAYDANVTAKALAQENGHALYADYSRVFLDEDNAEIMLVTKYKAGVKSNGYENTVRPASVSNSRATGANPVWEFVQSFPMADGKSIENHPDYNENIFWKNRDPRFYAIIGYNSMEWVFEERKDISKRQWSYTGNNQEGASNTLTGFYLKKSTDNSLAITETAQTGLDWVEIRYAEVLLNLAECANELGKSSEAYDELIAIRKRAGIAEGENSLYGLASGLDKDQLRASIFNERKIELCFENKRHFDLRRRNLFIKDLSGNADLGLNGTRRSALRPVLDTDYLMAQYPVLATTSTAALQLFEASIRDTVNWDNPSNYDLYFNHNLVEMDLQDINFLQPQYNFYFMPQTALDKNPNLVQTVLWSNGTFDPLTN